jgi:predicted RNase H-like HicB family nuclease
LRFDVVVERSEDGCYVAYALELLGRHTQAKTSNKLVERIKEATELYPNVNSRSSIEELASVQFIEVEVSRLKTEDSLRMPSTRDIST